MANQKFLKKIAIIGAGISGLILAKKLSASSEVVVFDKSRGVGGRMATRRVPNYHFDHGAQFFTAKSKEFQDFCADLEKEGVIEDWKCDFAEISGSKVSKIRKFDLNKAHYVAKPQMNSLCKYLAKDLDIRLEKQIEEISFQDSKWSLRSNAKEIFKDFDLLILSIPSNQAIKLLPQNFKYFGLVENIKMSGCFTLMLGFKESLNLDFEAALIKDSNLSWVSVNSSKPERPNGFALLVNSDNKWADDNIESDLELVKSQMIFELKKIVNFDVNNIEYQNIHRWRYANAAKRLGDKSLFDSNLNLGICGDWMISGRVESAFLSGIDLYQNIKNR